MQPYGEIPPLAPPYTSATITEGTGPRPGDRRLAPGGSPEKAIYVAFARTRERSGDITRAFEFFPATTYSPTPSAEKECAPAADGLGCRGLARYTPEKALCI